MYLIFFLSRNQFNRPNNLGDSGQRIRAEMEQISPDIIERGVQCLHSCVSAKYSWPEAISTFALHFIVNLRCMFVFF
jgi:hypothetical protein